MTGSWYQEKDENMDKIIVKGGKPLRGSMTVSGSKNAALPILFATLLTDQPCVITNVPTLADIKTTLEFLTYIGKNVNKKGSVVTITGGTPLKSTAPYELVRKMRASALVLGPILARLGQVKVSLPGGCAIGARPIDIHLESFAKMGAKITVKAGYVDATATVLNGSRIIFRYASVGATENVLLASVLAKGTTVIENAAKEPEIVDLADALKSMGARIRGAGTRTITVEGADSLKGMRHRVIPDRIEAATYLIAAAATRGKVTVKDARADHIGIVLKKLAAAGVAISVDGPGITASWKKPLKPVSIRTDVYPGFPTDVQAQWMALMSTVKGTSRVTETVFENRFLHVCELQRLGADMRIEGNKVIVRGTVSISGAPIMVSDLRAGAALVIAGLIARGETVINRIYHLDRGYELLEKKLRSLGANIRRVS